MIPLECLCRFTLSLPKSDADGAMEDVDASVNTEKRRKKSPDNPNSWVKYFDFFLFLLPLQLEGVGEVLKSR